MCACAKIVGGRGSAPDPAGGAYDAPPDPLVGFFDFPPRTLPRLKFPPGYATDSRSDLLELSYVSLTHRFRRQKMFKPCTLLVEL